MQAYTYIEKGKFALLEKAKPNAVMNSFDELPQILSRQNAWSYDLN